jgi:hypothetical protein
MQLSMVREQFKIQILALDATRCLASTQEFLAPWPAGLTPNEPSAGRVHLSWLSRFSWVILSGAVTMVASSLGLGAAPANVYFVLGADTAIWNDGATVDVLSPQPYYSPGLFTDPKGPAYQVINEAFRRPLRDSFGHPLKLTWWLMAGNIFRYAANGNVPIANTMNLYLMKRHHGAVIQQLGDELSLHYHTFIWSDYTGGGTFFWNQARRFEDCRDDFEFTLAQCLLDEEVFPVSFRSGWHYMDNDWQQYLDQIVPFSMHNNWPVYKPWVPVQPINNVQDWSLAPSDFVPFHPSLTNYQVPGDGRGYNVRSVKMQNLSQAHINQIFEQAAGGTDQVACLWSHLPENFAAAVTNTVAHITNVSALFPQVRYRYCTAVEAMQRWLGQNDREPPTIRLAEAGQGQTAGVTIQTIEPIFQSQPFVACRDIFQRYYVVPCIPNGTQSWQASMPVPRSQIAKVGIAVTDLNGNLATRILRYLPDDLFLDTTSKFYSETSGTWETTTNAAWGATARVALLNGDEGARARWTLPITWTGPYDVFAQVPAVPSSAGNVRFSLLVDETNLLSTGPYSALPPKQWLYLGTATLDARHSNVLEMTATRRSQALEHAMADVIKLTVSVQSAGGLIFDVHVDSFDTTANLTWSTHSPVTTQVKYGPDLRLGNIASPQPQLSARQAATLTGLMPGTSYAYQIDANSGAESNSYWGFFTTTNFEAIESAQLIFDLNHPWSYTATNLDGVNWPARDYDDSWWFSGAGILWVDTRTNGPNPAIRPLTTRLPANPVTGFPYTTYYFRTHFNWTTLLTNTTLIFTNWIDDGARFFVNGTEIYRNNLSPSPSVITNGMLAAAYNCGGDATCAVTFAMAGIMVTNLTAGDNVLAVEVHNYSARSPDVTFGTVLSSRTRQILIPSPELKLLRSGERTTLYWNGSGFRLQQASRLESTEPNWEDVPGPIIASPYTITNHATTFYRLAK